MYTCLGVLGQGHDAANAILENEKLPVRKLWSALWGAYGWAYLSLGLLKLLGDALNFAGMPITALALHMLSCVCKLD